jgi:hypothetical protein
VSTGRSLAPIAAQARVAQANGRGGARAAICAAAQAAIRTRRTDLEATFLARPASLARARRADTRTVPEAALEDHLAVRGHRAVDTRPALGARAVSRRDASAMERVAAVGALRSQKSFPLQSWWHSHETGSPWSPGSEGKHVECDSWATGGALMAPSAPAEVFPAKGPDTAAEQRCRCSQSR